MRIYKLIQHTFTHTYAHDAFFKTVIDTILTHTYTHQVRLSLASRSTPPTLNPMKTMEAGSVRTYLAFPSAWVSSRYDIIYNLALLDTHFSVRTLLAYVCTHSSGVSHMNVCILVAAFHIHAKHRFTYMHKYIHTYINTYVHTEQSGLLCGKRYWSKCFHRPLRRIAFKCGIQQKVCM